MYWWQTPFSSSVSSSSSSSFKHNQSDGSALRRIFSFRGQFFGSRHRRLSRKFRHLSDGGGVFRDPPPMWKSPSRQDQSSVEPQPLPLPELTVLLPRDAASSLNPRSSLVNVPLPSPKQPLNRDRVERERPDGLTGDANRDGVTTSSAFEGMIACCDSRKSKDRTDTRQSRLILQELNVVEKFEEKYGINRTVSAPTSSLSSPTLSPQRITGDIYTSHHMSPQIFQHWCAPEMPPPDMNLGLGLSCQTSSDKTALSVESSPLHSPRTSPRCSTGSPHGPTSPLHRKLSLDTPKGWHESNAHANVHPLPRPPGSTTPSHSIPQVTAKLDLMPIKSQWQKGKLIGRGSFGSVYVASNRETGALCAMKEVELFLDDPKSAESIKQLEQEIKLLSQLKHPNIVQYYGSEIIEGWCNIYLEYVHPGSINKYIRDHCGAITESVVRNFTRHILSGLAYLHSTKTIHRDIKGANLLVDANGVVKLADFGMAKHLAGPATILSLKGSPYWMAPELLQSMMQKDTSSDLALAVDIWSLGCTIIEMLNGKPPWSEYEGAAAMFKVMRETPPIPETLSPEGKDFLRCCLRRNPAERPSAKTLLEHRFLKNSQQLDVPTFTRAFDGMKLMDNLQSSRERPACKLESLLSSPVPQTRGKLTNFEVGQQSCHKVSNLKVVPRHSPSSTLEALPSLSPPHSGRSKLPSPSANAPNSITEGAKKNHYS